MFWHNKNTTANPSMIANARPPASNCRNRDDSPMVLKKAISNRLRSSRSNWISRPDSRSSTATSALIGKPPLTAAGML